MRANMLMGGAVMLTGLYFSPLANADNVPDISDFARADAAAYLTAPVQPGRDPKFALQFRTEDGLFCSISDVSLVCAREDGSMPGTPPPPPGRITYAHKDTHGFGFGQTDRWVDLNGRAIDLRSISAAPLLPPHHKVTVSSDSQDANPRLLTCWADDGSVAGCYKADSTYRYQLIVFNGDDIPSFRS